MHIKRCEQILIRLYGRRRGPSNTWLYFNGDADHDHR